MTILSENWNGNADHTRIGFLARDRVAMFSDLGDLRLERSQTRPRGRIERCNVARKHGLQLLIRQKSKHRFCGCARMEWIGRADVLEYAQSAGRTGNLRQADDAAPRIVVAGEDDGFARLLCELLQGIRAQIDQIELNLRAPS